MTLWMISSKDELSLTSGNESRCLITLDVLGLSLILLSTAQSTQALILGRAQMRASSKWLLLRVMSSSGSTIIEIGSHTTPANSMKMPNATCVNRVWL
jgi:hypothetical protein